MLSICNIIINKNWEAEKSFLIIKDALVAEKIFTSFYLAGFLIKDILFIWLFYVLLHSSHHWESLDTIM